MVHPIDAIGASIASGSFQTAGMIVAPCSMRTLGAIEQGSLHPDPAPEGQQRHKGHYREQCQGAACQPQRLALEQAAHYPQGHGEMQGGKRQVEGRPVAQCDTANGGDSSEERAKPAGAR